MIIIFIRTLIIYCVVLFVLRIMGKSELSKLSTFQMVILFMIAELGSIPIDSPTSSLINGIVAIFSLLFLQVILSFLSIKFERFKNFVNGKPSIIIDEGKINVDEMKKLRITINDLFEQLRIEDCPSPSDAEYAIMESNGELSVLSKEEKSELPLIFICDGFVYKNNFAKSEIEYKDFKKSILKKNISIENVFLAYLDSNKKIHVYLAPSGKDKYAKEIQI